MCHAALSSASFWSFLSDVDDDLADTVRRAGCAHCGGPLHVSDYPRKPRGALTDLPAAYFRRRSFSCGKEGCRLRTTPPSVRFLGSKVYLGAVVVVATAMRQGPTPFGLRRLRELFGVDRRTVDRWRQFWTEAFPLAPFWRRVRARFANLVTAQIPRALVEAFGGTGDHALARLLGFLSPISTHSPLEVEVLDACAETRRGRPSPPSGGCP